LISFLVAVINIFSMALLAVGVVNLCIVLRMALLIIVGRTLCIMYSRGVRFLYTMAGLARLVPTLVLPYGLTDVGDASKRLCGN